MNYICSVCGFTESTRHLSGVYTQYDLNIMKGQKICTHCYCKGSFSQPSLFNCMKQVTKAELYAKMDSLTWPKLDSFTKAKYLVLFENQALDSSNLGMRSVLPVGPEQGLKTLEEIAGRPIGDVPSRFQYPVEYCEV